jgi:hypothetical protein
MELYRNISTNHYVQTLTIFGQLVGTVCGLFLFCMLYLVLHWFFRAAIKPAFHWLVRRVSISVSFQEDTKTGGGSKQT